MQVFSKVALISASFVIGLSVVAPAVQAEGDSNGSQKPTSQPIVGSVKAEAFVPTEKQLKEWNAPIKGFHPIKRVVRPIWKLKQQAADLQENIMKLQKPMDGLQPAFNSLEGKMQGVETRMGGLLGELGSMNKNIEKVSTDIPKITALSGDLNQVHKDLQEVVGLHVDIREATKVREDLQKLNKQMKQLDKPLNSLQKPMKDLIGPLEKVDSRLTTTGARLDDVHVSVGRMETQLTEMGRKIDQLQKPIVAVNEPLNELRVEVAELNDILRAAVYTCIAVVISAVLATITGLAILYRMRHSILSFTKRETIAQDLAEGSKTEVSVAPVGQSSFLNNMAQAAEPKTANAEALVASNINAPTASRTVR
jgi:predicted  nucleic acid-binding Zn-ribbon protein